MNALWDLIAGTESVNEKLVTSGIILVLGALLGSLIGRLLAGKSSDRYRAYYVAKAVHYACGIAIAVSFGILWRPFAGQLGLVIGLVSAGLAFALQEPIGALAGWFTVISGTALKVGDRVKMGGVSGDVIDISPFRTKIMEMGSSSDNESWVKGRQHTGRIVSISNRTVFSEPVYNYSSAFGFIWDEVQFTVGFDQWERAEAILAEEVAAISSTHEATAAIAEMTERFPLAATELETHVFVTATDTYVELDARYIIPVRTARTVKDQFTRTILTRFAQADIKIAPPAAAITLTNTLRADPTVMAPAVHDGD